MRRTRLRLRSRLRRPTKTPPHPNPTPNSSRWWKTSEPYLVNGKFQDALPKADELLQQAKAKSDKIGEAYALRFRAFALQEMRKTTPDQLPEVASVWASALALWREIGDEAYASGGAAGSGVLRVARLA
jgi:hypothetical protein